MVKLGDVINAHYGKALKADQRVSNGSVHVFGSSGIVGNHDKTLCTYPTIIIGRKGSVGAVTWAPDGGWIIDTAYYIEIKDNSKLDLRYLFHTLSGIDLTKKTITTSIPGLNRDDLYDTPIQLPSFEEQKRIVVLLDKAMDIRQKREQSIKLADEFLRVTFLAMFGDPIENPKGWDVASLLEYGSFKNGMNFTKGESGSVLKCLGVGDFKSLATITCMNNIGEIELNTPPSTDYLLNDGDIVFVRSNGNKALVGRCLTIYPGKEKVTFSGFCIRYRIENSATTPEYLNFLFRTPSMKQQMLSGGQGANIQNISQGTLSALRIPVPPLEKQLEFSKVVSFHSALMEKLDINTAKTEDMFDSISQQYFN
ncbi:restriction endonuclease subunit S [Kluyvera ascorbata]|uniref:restriction endonuclease subunit S n=1 Tax=Kluyvera ascorbata TaxID=51288 RepID=UPI00290449FB|nr:restriction endonuclease subunit S [Kluyvera ascorbata]MDU1197278.1 restriction endonuclease subunit S [Kluyvera ascorbata]